MPWPEPVDAIRLLRADMDDVAVRVLGDFLLEHARGEREGVFRQVAASQVNLVEIGAQLQSTRAALMDAGRGAVP